MKEISRKDFVINLIKWLIRFSHASKMIWNHWMNWIEFVIHDIRSKQQNWWCSFDLLSTECWAKMLLSFPIDRLAFGKYSNWIFTRWCIKIVLIFVILAFTTHFYNHSSIHPSSMLASHSYISYLTHICSHSFNLYSVNR